MRFAKAVVNKLLWHMTYLPISWLEMRQTCQSNLKKDKTTWETGRFHSTQNYGLGDLNGGRAETRPFFSLPQGSPQ